MLNRIARSPILVRVFPFAVFAALTFVQGRLGETSQYWIYALKTLVGAGLVWMARPQVPEAKWEFSWQAVGAGIAVFLLWVGLDDFYPKLAERSESFNPVGTYSAASVPALGFLLVRLLGSALVVPMVEEVFYRSFLYRYLIRCRFLEVPLGYFDWKAFLFAGVVFGVSHYEWLAAILCAFIYQGLVCHKGRLGDAITAHGITNFLLALWVIFRGAYYFW